jgi:acyl-CoA thioesterase-1
VAASTPRIVFLGDSLTAGYGLDPDQSVPALVQKRLQADGYPYEVVNAGVSGDTSAGGLRRLAWSLDGDVRVLVIELGANDGLRGLPVEDLRKNLTEVIATAQGRHIKVLLTGMEAPPNYGPAYTSDFRRVYQELARTPGVTFMPFYLEGVAGNPELNIRDGIHPNPEGARIVERNVWKVLEPLLDKPAR